MRSEVSAQPFLLTRSRVAAANFSAFAIQHDDVPRAEIVAVIALLWITGCSPEIIEIRSRATRMEFVIAHCWLRAGSYTTPGFVVAIVELFLCAGRISVVADGEDLAGD